MPQHGSPPAPQWTHILLARLHSWLAAVQTLPAQHICPVPPQVPQLPFMHVPVMPGHMFPEPVQKPAMQQPPPLQLLSAQHA
jgi:hypothetical protein